MSTLSSIAAAAPSKVWDAVVIGAGPAGAIAARQLALDGRRVLLVEKARLPRDKVCGGCIGGAALEALASIGLGDLVDRCGGVPLSTFEMVSAGGVARMPIGRRVAVSRRTFDDARTREAAHAGAVVCDQTLASLEEGAERDALRVGLRRQSDADWVWARMVVVATGLGGSWPGTRTQASARSRVGVGAILTEPPCKIGSGVLQMALGDAGYVGLAEVENGHYDVAAAIDPRALSAASAGEVIQDILQRSGRPPAFDLRQVKWRGTPPLTRRTRPVAGRRWLLVGDAAGYVEPFTGEGIGWAMHSAILATSLLRGPAESWDEQIAARWMQLYERSLGSSQRSCRLLSGALRVGPLRRLMTWGIGKAPFFSRPIVRRLDRGLAPPPLSV